MRDSIVLDLVDPVALSQKAAVALHPRVGLSFTGVAIRGASGIFAMHGVAGGRHEAVLRQIRLTSGQGVGGKVVALRRPFLVTDYVSDPVITSHFRDLAVMESLGAMAAVPVISDGDVTAVIYAAARDDSVPGDVGLDRLTEAAGGLADLFGASVRHDDAVRHQAAADRMRIAEELHDTVGQILFAIGASARRLRAEADGLPDLVQLSATIEDHAGRATGMLRDALRRLAPRSADEALPIAVRVAVEEFSQSTGLATHLVVLGETRTVSADGAAALLNVVREGLLNAAKHARASLVLVTLSYSPDAVEIAVQDDGAGLPPGFSLKAIPGRTGGGFGLPSLLRRVQQQGGTLTVRPAEQGGTTVRASLPEKAT
ncbi:MAG TPA: ATP-binding protein [Acidimicrobiia bacterium]|nr:ATP-binding protein [Acidimicrobiia bacterium]